MRLELSNIEDLDKYYYVLVYYLLHNYTLIRIKIVVASVSNSGLSCTHFMKYKERRWIVTASVSWPCFIKFGPGSKVLKFSQSYLCSFYILHNLKMKTKTVLSSLLLLSTISTNFLQASSRKRNILCTTIYSAYSVLQLHHIFETFHWNWFYFSYIPECIISPTLPEFQVLDSVQSSERLG